MSWQEPVVALAVLAAVAYLVWKLGFASRPKRARRPDVRARDLVRKKRGRGKRTARR